jgi:hypothetical protein
MTVEIENRNVEGSGSSFGVSSFITGSGNKFTVFSVEDGTNQYGYPISSVDIYSGEIATNGIRNYYHAFIVTQSAYGTIGRGCGRMFYDSDGFSEKIGSASGRKVTIDMYDSYSDGWDHYGALRINVNGVDYSNARLSSGGFGSHSFYVSPGDLVNIYWTGNYGDYHNENAFVVYYTDTAPVPTFNSTSWNGSNALLFRLTGSLSNDDLNQLLGSFTATKMRTLSSTGVLHQSIHSDGK